MDKQDFLDKLRLALSGRVAPEVLTDTVNYYEEYINTEVRLGKSESEVMSALGDPRLIARTICETRGGQAGNGYAEQESSSGEVRKPYRQVPGWVWLVLILIIVVLVLSTVFKLLSIFWPFIAVMAVVIFLMKLFRDWIN